MIKIQIITPAPPGSLSGNRATATRWAGLLREVGYSVSIGENRLDLSAEVLIALHAWRSAALIQKWKQTGKPLILALTGTDLYRYQYSHPDIFYASLDAAHRLIGLHDLVYQVVPERFRAKLSIVYQSAAAQYSYQPNESSFDLCVVGHLREEKDPFRAAAAVALLPQEWPIRVLGYGKAHDEHWAELAAITMQQNPRYTWLGEKPHEITAQCMAAAKLMVISSVMEGGANVVSEACRIGLPILASDIPGNIGLLGEDYPGYFKTGDSQSLAQRIRHCYEEPAFVALLQEQISLKSNKFAPQEERRFLAGVISPLVSSSE